MSAFLALLGGILLSGLFGPVLAIAQIACVAFITRLVLFACRLRPPRVFAPLWAMVVLGALRGGIDVAAPAPGAGMPPPSEAIRAEVLITRVVQRHRMATQADAQLLQMWDPSGMALPPDDGAVRIRFSGFLDLPEGRVVGLRAWWLPPSRPTDAVSPAWPRGPPRPSLAIVAESDVVVLAGPGLPDERSMDRVRSLLATRLRQHLDGPAADFALAVLLGEGNGIDAGTRADLAALGTAHVLSVSGLHVAAAAFLVGLVVVRLLGPILVRVQPSVNLVAWHMGAAILAAWGVSLLANSPPPAVRSAGMFTMAAFGALLGRPQAVETAVATTGLASLIVWPCDAMSISFLLSYGAILGLAFLGPPLVAMMLPVRWREVPAGDLAWPVRTARVMLIALASSIAATLATTPLTLLAFRQTGPAGPLANLFAIPATTLIVMPAALGLVVVAGVAPGLMSLAAPPVGWILDAFLWTQRVAARALPNLVAPHLLVFAAVLSLSFAAIAFLARPRPGSTILAALAGLALALALPGTPRPSDESLVITFLDVGKGDAVLVRCPTGRTFLVDAGEGRIAERPSGLVAKLRAAGIDRLDGLVLTHADEDHVGGVPFLLRALSIGEVIPSCPAMNVEPLAGMLAGAREMGIPVRCAIEGVDPMPGCVDPSPVLSPAPFVPAKGNAASLVFRLAWKGRSILMTGDLEIDGEEALVDSGIDLHADVLKLGHHGSPGASSPAFLEAVRPEVVVVSGYRTRRQRELSPRTAGRVHAVGANLLATTEVGDVTAVVESDGSITVGGTRTPGPRFKPAVPSKP